MNARRLLPLAGFLAVTLAVAVDDHTTDRITPPAAAQPTPPTRDIYLAEHVIPTSREWVAGDCATFFALAMDAGWTWNDWPTLSRIMWRESRCLPDAYNGRGRDRSYGLVQLNTRGGLWDQPIGWGAPALRELCGLTTREDLFEPFTNLACARKLYEIRGWKPWS